ncbi:hypothetical protein QFZ30_000125 [Arthrobacter pascens]|uniref:hypothetical protein n=1 Tax=Arthrobacter pascens TaxID=1677 RepID=UPI002791FD82|nr:hypothetical protein [Arthrobacter pascens]MDQ0676743.1 hypothetical protein [Arthrobacter pascens]
MSDIAGSSNGGAVEQLLLEAELDGDDGLRPVLLELRALATEQPEPSAAVAALMVPAAHQQAAAGPVAGAATDELAARRRAKRRITLTTLSVAVSLAAGGAVAAASDQGIRDSFGHAVTSFVSTVGGGPVNQPAETPAPVPAQPGGSASVPAPTAPAPAPSAPGADPAQGPQNLPSPATSQPVHLPELPVPENLTPGVPGGPLNGAPPNGEGQPPALPLPATPPVPLPSPAP